MFTFDVAGASASEIRYSNSINPQWVRLLNTLEMNVRYTRCEGAILYTDDGRRIVDFLSGYCVHNAGHNHPAIIQALKDELDRRGPEMLQSHVPELAGELGAKLCERAGGRLNKAFFACSGSEGVEAAIKFARAATRRNALLSAKGAFHRLTCGALSLMDDPFWKDGFGPMLADTAPVEFGDLAELERRLATRQFAAFVVEPVQSEAGIVVPAPGYLKAAGELCHRYGTLFVLDEVQTGMYRTGKFLAAHHFAGVDPDMVVLAKALSGGLIPVSALLMTDKIYDAVFTSLKRSIVHTSTFSENAMSMRAGLATLDVLEGENLGERALAMGDLLRGRLRENLAGYEMVKGVVGMGMLNGVQFAVPRSLTLRAGYEAFKAIHPGMFGQVIVMRLFRDHGFLTQIWGNNFMTLKVAPPLVVEEADVEGFAGALRQIVHEMHNSTSFWAEALGLARRVTNV
jgi:ornithine--oxo-acid transaminase